MTQSQDYEKFFLKEKPVEALTTLRKSREGDNVYVSVVSKRIDTTYAHTVKVLDRMENAGLIKTRKDGRKKILELTERGEAYADEFITLTNMFEDGQKKEDIRYKI
jgi:DNA-binding MarR family transcriptional regulator